MVPARPPFSLSPLRTELGAVLGTFRSAFIGLAVFGALINVLMLTGSFFMLQVYDRVLPSRSVPTLVGLAILAAGLFALQGILDLIRGRLLVRIGTSLDETLSGKVFDSIVQLPLKSGARSEGTTSLRDMENVRTFMSGQGPTALFDLPWIPFYLGICFLFHFWIGMTALLGAVALVAITLSAEILTRKPVGATSQLAAARSELAESSRRNAEVLMAMGMGSRIREIWSRTNRAYIAANQQASDVAGSFGAVVKVLRMMLQSAVLGVGAYLVIHQEASAGIIIAGSILSGRALAPVDLAIANWRGLIAARGSWHRLNQRFALLGNSEKPLALPAPRERLEVRQASAAPPGGNVLVVQDISFSLKAGTGLGIIGPSAAGKSCLSRLLVGVWQPVRGKVCLDGAALDQWAPDDLGRYIGYLPQDVELMAGTVAQNIARFDPDATAETIVAAAKAAGVHDMIVGLSDGYETQIGEQGRVLSAGQQQWVALARALYGNPFLVVLDEPNSNLDNDGEEALTRAIEGVRARGGIAIVVAHRMATLSAVDQVLVMDRGRVQAFGPKDEILSKVLRRPPAPVLRPVASEGTRS